MSTIISLISTAAAVIGLFGILPQLITMVRARSAGGQSTLGWGLGATTNLALSFVNGLGYHAAVLAAGNALSLAGCLTAVCLVRRFGNSPVSADTTPPAVAEMHTSEFFALREAVVAEHRRRCGELVAA
jgi:hypothetical protein